MELTKVRAPNDVKWVSTGKQEKALTEIKRVFSNEPILKLPDLNWECILQTDPSNLSLGACLLQEYDGGQASCPVLQAESCSCGNKTIPSCLYMDKSLLACWLAVTLCSVVDDHSRVVLRDCGPEHDYINASYISVTFFH